MIEIAVTGIGVISPLGIGRGAFWESCRKATTGIKKITSFDTTSLRSNMAGWIDDFNPRQFMPPKSYRRMGRVSMMAVASSVEALQDSGLDLNNIDKERIAIIMGTAYGSSSHIEDFYVSLLEEGPRGAHPFLFPETVPNAPASHIAMYHGITGPNNTFCQNELSAENAIMYARNLLLQNLVDVALVGGADELSAMQYSCYDSVGALNKVRVEEGETTIRPEPGGGLIIGEGAGILIMEKLDFARERDARIYGVLKSCAIRGGVTDIGHYEIEGEQMARAVFLAIEDAGMDPGEVDQIDISANFTGELDRMEYDQLRQIFRGRNNNLEVTPLKYLMGEFGGTGIIRAAAILLSIHSKLPLPTVSAEVLRSEAENIPVWNISTTGKTDTALMTSATFGGGTSSLIFTKQ
jgi:3-oxoacyl-[acyl-carrier-protein] synthase II